MPVLNCFAGRIPCLRRLASRRGQNTVEYMLMLTVIVGVVLIGGMALKRYMPTLVGSVVEKITGAINSLGSSAGNS